MSHASIEKFVKENGPLIVPGVDGKPVINAKHAFYFQTNLGIPVDIFQEWVNELLSSKTSFTSAV